MGLRWWRICLKCGRPGFDSWIGKILWRRAWQPIPVVLPGESPWTEESGGLQSMGSQRVRHDWLTKHSIVEPHDGIRWSSREFPTCSHFWSNQMTSSWGSTQYICLEKFMGFLSGLTSLGLGVSAPRTSPNSRGSHASRRMDVPENGMCPLWGPSMSHNGLWQPPHAPSLHLTGGTIPRAPLTVSSTWAGILACFVYCWILNT